MDDIAARLADGRPFLLGDAFDADLAFAALTAPCILLRTTACDCRRSTRPGDAAQRFDRVQNHREGASRCGSTKKSASARGRRIP
jgi:hypothetical protein